MRKARVFAAAILALILLASCRSIKSPEYLLSEEDSPNQVRIVQISDFHSNDFGTDEETLLQKIREAKPDVIVLTGDIFDFEQKGEKPVGNVRLLLSGIQGLCPFYYVNGNHEFFGEHNDEYSYIIEEYGGTVLYDTAALVDLEKAQIVIAGVSDPFSDLEPEKRKIKNENRDVYRSRIKKASDAAKALVTEDTRFSVLLAHRPEYIDDYLDMGFDLVLSGHAHGGQWRFLGINGLYAPGQGIFPKYAGGRYDFVETDNATVFIVSRGLSWQRPAVPRIFNNPELVVIIF